ncbi:hypothetical protein DCAR_0729811 [Daucus carota subsp. sativus]|uniref:Transmembrane protein 53 n=1 Tax=Daucus carota subsp. sativus TaxID=79200 RepID=A0AAF0XP26_DAUCS|nr:PREDICTED: transmembrane protein 53 [Daucus carota subsp. sativus]WOH10344.1 hypothetical protein DCAR_0729811 [Daucus carota subsp. sativus]
MKTKLKILNPHIPNSIFLNPIALKSLPIHPHTIKIKPYSSNPTLIHPPFPHPNLSKALNFFHSLSHPHSNPISRPDPFARITSPFQNNTPHQNFTFNKGLKDNASGTNCKDPIFTVVLLGWLGSKRKHMRRYAELYESRGIQAVTFVAPVKDMLSVDLGRAFWQRISGLVVEISDWLSEKENDGRERFLMFHTFSNTGWLAYGAILDDLQGRPDILDKIKGCVIDSGGDPNIDPKVWAAGFGAALLKKRSSAAYPSVEAGEKNAVQRETNVAKLGPKKPFFAEVAILLVLEKFFSFLLNTPDLNQKLTKIISVLSNNQPPCPQLYLYSSDDKVIPYQSVELFIKKQKDMGRTVHSFNFKSSPHVDHYRTYPTTYYSQLQSFLEECLATVKQL